MSGAYLECISGISRLSHLAWVLAELACISRVPRAYLACISRVSHLAFVLVELACTSRVSRAISRVSHLAWVIEELASHLLWC